ncbi:unnamed protein product [Parnassius mnemosyne]|uniref:Uncharacterized protein n=1 Tax=Parnassius mnemosyne TaxID=213953 RepID=A0AAV1LIQ9_9NEOP
MKVQLLILFCACIIIVKADTDSDEAKYIDLLPEEEKQEFLNRIARRILAEVKSGRNAAQSSIEVTDEKLNENDAYVQKIMEEESESIKNERRLGIELKNKNPKDDDNVDIRVKPLHENEFNGEENSENIDLTAYETKKRMKKDTPENRKPTSDENIPFNRNTVSEIPVHVIYDDENVAKGSNFNNDNVEVRKDNDKDVLIKEGPNPTSYDHEKQDSHDRQNESEKSDVINMRKSNTNIDLEENIESKDMGSIPQTPSNDFGLQQDEFEKQNAMIPNDNVKKSSTEAENPETKKGYIQEIDSPQENGADDSLVMKYRENATENNLDTRSNMTEVEKVTVDNNQLVTGLTTDASYVLNTNSVSIKNNTASTSGEILRNEVNLGRIKSQPFLNNTKDKKIKSESESQTNKIGIHYNKNFTNNDNLETYIASSKDDLIEDNSFNNLTLKQNNNYEKNTSNEVKMNNKGNSSDKTVLRQLNEDSAEDAEYASTEEINVKTKNSYSFLPYNTHNTNHYNVYEISKDNPPFVPSEQKSTVEFVEEPFYVPVYNYAPSNAFYSAYNHFGPNYKENYKLIPNIGSSENEKSYKNNNLNNHQDYTRSNLREKNSQWNSNQSSNNYEYKQRSVAHKSNLRPFSKGFDDVIFKPYEYLDMDYYLGRNSKEPASVYNYLTNGKSHNLPFKHMSKDLILEDNSGDEDVIDPDPSAEQYNMKDNIRDIRKILYLQKYKQAKQTLDKKGLEDKTQLRKQNYLLESSFRENDETKFDRSYTHDPKKIDIAADYYYSRMNKDEPLIYHTKPKIFLGDKNAVKTDKGSKSEIKPAFKNIKVLQEKRLIIPFRNDSMLKIDLDMTEGNKMNIIFREVKRSERNKFRAYLSACLNVLKDMIEHDNKGLLVYDWLSSTVDIQSAIRKLFDLTNNLQKRRDVHYSDVELIKYIMYLFKSSNTRHEEDKRELIYKTRSGNHLEKHTVKRKTPLPKNYHKKCGEKIEKPLQLWIKQYKTKRTPLVENNVLLEFEDFLTDLQESLYELHEAIKQIATVTKFNKQAWFNDLKVLHLLPVSRSKTLGLLLHLVTTKLFRLIEESAKSGLEENFVSYVQNHQAEVENTKAELIFVLRLLKEIKTL